jgi:hypothetical protein
MKKLLQFYLASSVTITTTATVACFYWYIPEYYTAVKIDRDYPERAAIHRTNALWLGLWGGIYGLTGVTAATGLALSLSKSKKEN